MKPRGTLRVLVNPEHPEYRLDLFDARENLLKWRKITTDGLLHTNDGVLERGPVSVPNMPHYRRLIRQGALIAVPTTTE